ncbi:hypothetical protein LZ32DRAFT_382186 [Colletotrichum eremochloae]|nr:hypothetical protein LZ32DRAFT_382186 [Colletotrichum eremochloae]
MDEWASPAAQVQALIVPPPPKVSFSPILFLSGSCSLVLSSHLLPWIDALRSRISNGQRGEGIGPIVIHAPFEFLPPTAHLSTPKKPRDGWLAGFLPFLSRCLLFACVIVRGTLSISGMSKAAMVTKRPLPVSLPMPHGYFTHIMPSAPTPPSSQYLLHVCCRRPQ